MGFHFKWTWGLSLIVLLAGTVSLVAETDRDSLQATAVVINSAQVPPAIMRQAERDSGRIFLAAGIEILWVNCGPESSLGDCPPLENAGQFVLHIVPHGAAFTDSVFGVAFLGDDGRGRYCDVFFDGIEAMKNDPEAGEWQLLGAVMTHELGHLLLGTHSHSPVGIMMPVWNYNGVRLVGTGNLYFTSEESSRIRSRVRTWRIGAERSGPVVASRREPYLLLLGGLQ